MELIKKCIEYLEVQKLLQPEVMVKTESLSCGGIIVNTGEKVFYFNKGGVLLAVEDAYAN